METTTEDNLTIGIVDSIITSLQLLGKRDMSSIEIRDAILDLRSKYEAFIKHYLREWRYSLITKQNKTPEEERVIGLLDEEIYLFPTRDNPEDERLMKMIRDSANLLREQGIIK